MSLAVILHIILYIYTHWVRGSTDHLWNLTFLKAANNELSKYYLWQSCIRDGFQQCSVSCKEFPLESCPVMAKDCFCCFFFPVVLPVCNQSASFTTPDFHSISIHFSQFRVWKMSQRTHKYILYIKTMYYWFLLNLAWVYATQTFRMTSFCSCICYFDLITTMQTP